MIETRNSGNLDELVGGQKVKFRKNPIFLLVLKLEKRIGENSEFNAGKFRYTLLYLLRILKIGWNWTAVQYSFVAGTVLT